MITKYNLTAFTLFTGVTLNYHSKNKSKIPEWAPAELAHLKNFSIAAENPDILKSKKVNDLTVEEMAVEIERFRGPRSHSFTSVLNLFARFHKPLITNFSQYCKFLSVTTDCRDAGSSSERCQRIQAELFQKSE